MTNSEPPLRLGADRRSHVEPREEFDAGLEFVRITESNIALLEVVDDDIFDGDLEPDRITRFVLDAGHLLVVATRDNVVIGQVQGSVQLHLDSAPQLYVDNVGVSPKHQRQRIGSGLLEAIVDWAVQLGCEQAWIVTEPDNEAANALYESIGAERSTAALYSISITAHHRG